MVNERQEEGQKVKEMQEEDKIKYRQKEIKKNVTKKTKVKPCQYRKINCNIATEEYCIYYYHLSLLLNIFYSLL